MPKGYIKKFSEEETKEIIRLYKKEKISLYKIAKKFNISHTVIKRVLQKNNIKIRKYKKILLKEDIKEQCNQIEKEREIKCLNSQEYIRCGKNNLRWLCLKDYYEWSASLNNIKKGNSCPKCAKHVIYSIEEIINICNQIEKEREIKCLNLQEYTKANFNNLNWLCLKDNHTWKTSFTSINLGSGCPKCAGKAPITQEDIQNLEEKTGLKCLNFKKYINSASNNLDWYNPKCKHTWNASYSKIRGGNNCPYCVNLKINIDNCLSTLNPELAKQWHPTKNGTLTPYDVGSGSTKKVWWQCRCGNEWEALIVSRNKERDCPSCSSGISERICKSVFEQLFNKPFNKIRPDWLINSETGNKLELDGYNEELKIAFEHQGIQHYKKNNFFCTEKEFKKRIKLDKIKVKKCKEKGIFLVVIPSLNFYLEKENLKNFIIEELKKQNFEYDYEKLEKIEIDFSRVETSRTKFYYNKMKKLVEENNGELLSNNYINAKTKYKMKCKIHEEIFEMRYGNLQQGNWRCPKCHVEKRK